MKPRHPSSAGAKNPFEYGRELAATELCDRTSELAKIERTAVNVGKLFLIGPRRYGKTSLLHAAQERLERRGVTVLRFDAERYETLDLLAQALLRDATRVLRGPIQRAREVFATAAKRLQPELSYDGVTQEWRVSLGLSRRTEGGALPVLVDTLDAIERLAKATDRPVMVILDEFQQVVTEGGAEAERQLRAAVQQHRHVSYVFAGSATRVLADMVTKRGRPFYRLGEPLYLSILPREDFCSYVRARFTAAGFEATQAGLDRLLDVVEEVPLSVQRVAHECWERCRDGDSARVDEASVDAALEAVLGQENPTFTRAWTSLTRAQKVAFKAVVVEGGHAMFSHAVAERARASVATLQRAIRSLEQAQWVRRDEEGSPTRYRVEDPLFAAWVRWAQALEAPGRAAGGVP